MVEPLRRGKRVTIVDAQLATEKGLCAVARATLIGSSFDERTPIPAPEPRDPSALPPRVRRAPHGKPWLMDAMESRAGEGGTAWFRLLRPIAAVQGAMSRVLPAADWAHGIWPPLGADRAGLAAIPNPDVTVHLMRAPAADWIGVDAATAWSKEGVGAGWGALRDTHGAIGCVAMSVAVTMLGN